MAQRPAFVGVLCLEVYCPSNQVDVGDLEQVDGCPGKYTKGLEQVSLSFANENEDAVSIALTCVHFFLEKYSVDPRWVGRLEVGSESNPDRCKSIKSHLMQLFGAAGNRDIEGVDNVHACYGGTAALLNCINWVESSSWDGRYALAVAADVALYEPKSSARATGGAGAVAILIGPNAPLVMDPAWRATYANNSQEFCKPVGLNFPAFDAPATVQQYLKAVDCTFTYLYRRLQKLQARVQELGAPTPFSLIHGVLPLVDYWLCHCPYPRLVRKAFARIALQDAVRTPAKDAWLASAGVPARWRVCEPDSLAGAGYEDKALETAMLKVTMNEFEEKVAPGMWVQKQVGNTYTASVYMALAGLLESKAEQLEGRRLVLFSFGSGSMATVFSLVGRGVRDGGPFTLKNLAGKIQLQSLLNGRRRAEPVVFEAMLQHAQQSWGQVPRSPRPHLFQDVPNGVWLLHSVDEKHVRTYTRRVQGSGPSNMSSPVTMGPMSSTPAQGGMSSMSS